MISVPSPVSVQLTLSPQAPPATALSLVTVTVTCAVKVLYLIVTVCSPAAELSKPSAVRRDAGMRSVPPLLSVAMTLAVARSKGSLR